MSGDDDKQKGSSEWEEGRKAFFLEESGFRVCRGGLLPRGRLGSCNTIENLSTTKYTKITKFFIT